LIEETEPTAEEGLEATWPCLEGEWKDGLRIAPREGKGEREEGEGGHFAHGMFSISRRRRSTEYEVLGVGYSLFVADLGAGALGPWMVKIQDADLAQMEVDRCANSTSREKKEKA